MPECMRFDDPYFSAENGLAEAQHVFLAGNRLAQRFCAGFHIAELGFGTGLNLLAAWSLWRESGFDSPLRFTSFEAFPMSVSEMAKSHARWPELAAQSRILLSAWSDDGCINLPDLRLRVIFGDANQTVPNWNNLADAWFLDGFSPAKNPDMWSAQLLDQVAKHTAPKGSFATYTAAGHVRRNLSKAGFDVQRVAGFGKKRHMTTGQRNAHAR